VLEQVLQLMALLALANLDMGSIEYLLFSENKKKWLIRQ
jgi:hypothetical protein